MGSFEINSNFYAMRLLSHGLDISQIEAVESDEYPATEFSREEQTRGLEILRNIEVSETASFPELAPETIHSYLMYLADQIEGFATNDLSEAAYEIGRTDIDARLPKRTITKETNYLSGHVSEHARQDDKVPRARIILVDDHSMLLDALKGLLQDEFDVVGTFADGQAVVEAAPALNPDVIVLDIGMPIMNGLRAGEHLKKALPSVKLIYLTMNRDPDIATEAFRLGASGYVLKNSSVSELLSAIRGALLGRAYVTSLMTEDMAGSVIKSLKRKERPRLTLRQKEVLQLLAEGRSMKEAAFLLNVAPRTVASYKYTLMKRLHLETTADLTQFAINNLVIAELSLIH